LDDHQKEILYPQIQGVTSSQKGIFGLSNNVTFRSSLKLAQLTTLCPSPDISIEDDTMFCPKESPNLFHLYSFFAFIFPSQKTIQEGLTFNSM
jgi:hypothetical protein